MRKNGKINVFDGWLRRALSGVLALALLLGVLPEGALPAQAATQEKSWAMPYMEQLVEWGVMRGDLAGNLNPDRNITRAEFVTLINRAYGYTKVGKASFTDIKGTEWYADDINIAYNVGYFYGVSGSTAAPKSLLTREQAALMLARNMMLRENPGEVLDFTDGRAFSSWSRGMIKAITDAGVINGYLDGSFRPQNHITRGEAAAMLVRAVGAMINTPGNHALGNVYGNVTINTSGVALRDTVIVGDLYLTGGIGLGDVLLENVQVIGQIVVSGAGESNSAQSSVVLRNVDATEMIVDSINNQFVTVRSEGDTNIGLTSVRTNAYVEDAAPQGYGLKYIELDGENGTKLQLAGNVKEVLNLTPFSGIEVAQGVAGKVTVDERATSSTVTVDMGARIGELNLDVATNVSGAGDVKDLNVAASGSNVSIPPENVIIRPGVTATVANTAMDNVTAAEWSADPRLLAGYPLARDVSSSSADLVFSTNKAGTVYWAVTAVADGSVSEADVLRPPKNSGVIVASGNLQAGRSNTEYTAQIKKLTSGGSYYITTVMVDARGKHSPLKVTAFTVPDDTTPAFATGYPTMTKVTTVTAQVTVMPTKTCRLYYALLPKGSTAPTGPEFKANAIRGNLGYGAVDVIKNVTLPINVNDVTLEEQTAYDLYLWLTDYDGAKSSKVTKLTFTTADETAPVVTDIMNTDSKASSTEVTYSLNEPGTLYWAIVPESNESFMNYDLNTVEARVKVISGVGATKKGSSSASKADTDVRVNITGLNTATTKTTAYKLYYVAMDKQGNYSSPVGVLTVRTLDTTDPTVKLEFTSFNPGDKDTPRADTSLRLVFSESVRGGMKDDKLFMNLYNAVTAATGDETRQNAAREVLAAALRQHIELFDANDTAIPLPERDWTLDGKNQNKTAWTIDYRYATVEMVEADGSMVITFPTTADTEAAGYSALNLEGGASYILRLKDIYDNASSPRPLGRTDLPFRTVYAEIELDESQTQEAELADGTKVRLDLCLEVKPTTTSKTAATERWDMIMWSNTTAEIQVYRRDTSVDGPWEALGGGNVARFTITSGAKYSGISLRNNVINVGGGQPTFEILRESLKEKHVYEYGIHFVSVNGEPEKSNGDPGDWGEWVEMYFSIIAGGSNALGTVSSDPNKHYDSYVSGNRVTPIGVDVKAQTKWKLLDRQFEDRSIPTFQPDSPRFTAGSSTVHMELDLNKPGGTIYYFIAPAGSYTTTTSGKGGFITPQNDGSKYDGSDDVTSDPGGKTAREQGIHDLTTNRLSYIPLSGADRDRFKNYVAYMVADPTDATKVLGYSRPLYTEIVNPTVQSDKVRMSPPGGLSYEGITVEVDVTGLEPSTRDADGKLVESSYYAYFVIKGNGEAYSTVHCYRFTMGEVDVPQIDMTGGGTVARMTPDEDCYLSYVLVERNSLDNFLAGIGSTISYADPDTKESMTVLDALTKRPSNVGGKTYFDLYAGTTQRTALSNYIYSKGAEAGPASAPKGGDTRTVKQGDTVSWDVEKLLETDETEYIVLATARHVYGGTDGDSYGFAAARGFFKPDPVAPDYSGPSYIQPVITQVRDSSGNVVTDSTVWQREPTSYRYTGTVTVDFSKSVYLLINNQRYEVWAVSGDPTGTGSAGTSADNARGAINMLGGNKGSFSFAAANVTTAPTDTFTFTFRNITHGTTIRLFDGGSICNKSSWSTTKKLTLRFDTTLTMKDYPGGRLDTPWPGFYAEWK